MSAVAPKRIAVDFDGTLCDMAFPEIGPVKYGAKEALTMFRALGFRVVIWSCRTCHWDYDVYGGNPSEPTLQRERVKAMIAWLDENGIPYDEVDDGSKGKPGADYYIDDKGIRFSDNWVEIATFVLAQTAERGLIERQRAALVAEGKIVPFPQPVPTAPETDGPEVA